MELTSAELARQLGISRRALCNRAKRGEWKFTETKLSTGHTTHTYNLDDLPQIVKQELKPDEEFVVLSSAEYRLTDEEVLERYLNEYKEREKRKGSGITEIAFRANLPIGISFIGDQHIGRHCWFDRMLDDAEIIAKTEGIYAVIGGDGIDNYIKHQSAIINSGSRPTYELQAFRAYLKKFTHKILLLISGNHDAWTEDFASINIMRQLSKDLRILYSPNWQGLLRVNFLDDLDISQDGAVLKRKPEAQWEPYVILVRHKSSWNSRLNPEHACRRTFEQSNIHPDPDIIAIGHNHAGAAFPFEKSGKPRIGLRWSSYKMRDPYAIRHGYARSTIATCPTVVVYPGPKKMIGFADVRDAATFLAAERKRMQDEQRSSV